MTAADVYIAPTNGGKAAWMQVLAYFLTCIGTLGVQYAFSALYAELLDDIGRGSQAGTSLVGSLCAWYHAHAQRYSASAGLGNGTLRASSASSAVVVGGTARQPSRYAAR